MEISKFSKIFITIRFIKLLSFKCKNNFYNNFFGYDTVINITAYVIYRIFICTAVNFFAALELSVENK